MPIPLAVYAGVAVASAIAGGVMSSNASKRNAEAARNAALWNAQQVRLTGERNATLTGMAGAVNAASITAQSQLNNKVANQVNEFNVSLLAETNAYNQSLMEQDLVYLFEEAELDTLYLKQRAARTQGTVIANIAASGTDINAGSNAALILDNETNAAFDQFILAQQYDRESKKLLDAMALGDWETEQQIAKMNYETAMGNYGRSESARINAGNALLSSQLSAYGTRFNANQQALSIEYGGDAASASYQYQANQPLTSGIISGIGTAASIYAKGYSPSPSAPTGSGGNPQILQATGAQEEYGSLLA